MRHAIERRGLTGAARTLALRLRALVYLDEQHVWSVLALDRVDQRKLAEGYELRQGDEADLRRLEALMGMPPAMARARRADGAQLWLVLHGDDAAFACWIFPRLTPVRAAAGRMLELPRQVACLEDSFTAASHRGHGIAGAAWTTIAGQLSDEGFETLITKVEVDNAASRRAVEKAGFREARLMELRRRGIRERVALRPMATELSPSEQEVTLELDRRLAR